MELPSQLANEIIFQPLHMKNSAYEWKISFDDDFSFGYGDKGEKFKKDKDNEPRGGGTLETTAADYIQFLTAVLNEELISKKSYDEIFSLQIRIKSLRQFGEGSKITTNNYDDINLSYGLGWGYFETPYGKGVFKEGNGSGFQHYSILFPDTGKGLMIMTNSVNGNSIFEELSDLAIKNIYTPWEWQGYLPYDEK